MKVSKSLSRIFSSAKYYGCDEIIKSSLGLRDEGPLPITIPHGVDFYHLKIDLDLIGYEPIYIAFRDDIAERAAKVKVVLKFPHPWLLIVSEQKNQRGLGTLFIAPPPSQSNFETMMSVIVAGDYPKPWGVLIKERGTQPQDFLWWENHGFAVYSAGPIDDKLFFYKLRDIFAKYENVASPNMSSAIIFAAAMNRRALALPNVCLSNIDVSNWADLVDLDDSDGKIAAVWRSLLSEDLMRARSQAEDLLGMKYMGKPEELRAKLVAAIDSVAEKPVYLSVAGFGMLYGICLWLLKKKIPIHKLLPNPLVKVAARLLASCRLNRLTIYTGSDFAHYGLAGDHTKLRIRKAFAFALGKDAIPGNAVRTEVERAEA